MTGEDARTSSTAAPRTKSQKKKQRQKRSKAFKRLLAVQEGVQSSHSRLADVPEGWPECSMEHGELRDGPKAVSELSAPSNADSGSAVSSTHTFWAAATSRLRPTAASGRWPAHPAATEIAAGVAMRPGSADMPQHSATGAYSGLSSPRLMPPGGQPPRQEHAAAEGQQQQAQDQQQQQAQKQQPVVQQSGKDAMPHSAALLTGVLDAGCKRHARLGMGFHTDMTAALLVMDSMLASRAPLVPEGGGHRQDVALHGNYKRYYGYRWGTGSGEDPRLQVMERCWFAGKRCLDVGCNAGLVSLAVASRFGTAAMLGLDIDASLVHSACINLSRERGEVVQRLAEARRLGPPGATAVREAAAAQRALKAVWFQQGDMAGAAAPVEPGSVDTALCLSVTKWVHINGGDAGLRALFAALHAALAPGGLLVLEPQPWRSYKQALRKQDLTGSLHAGMLAGLQLRPDSFIDFLQREAGFRLVRQLHMPSDGSIGFDRPMYLLEKLAVE